MDFYEAKDADIVFLVGKILLNIASNVSDFLIISLGKTQIIYTTKCVVFEEIDLYVFVAFWTGCRLSMVAKLCYREVDVRRSCQPTSSFFVSSHIKIFYGVTF